MKSSISLILLATLCFLTSIPQISLGAAYTSGEINLTGNTSGIVLTGVETTFTLTSTIIIEDAMKDKIDQVRIEPPEGFFVPKDAVSKVAFAEGEIKGVEVKTNATEMLIKFPNSIIENKYLTVIFDIVSSPIPTKQAEFKVTYLNKLGELVTTLDSAGVDAIPNNNNSLTVDVLANRNNATIQVVPETQTIGPSKSFEVQINVRDIRTEIADAFFAFQFDLSFDPNIVRVKNIEEGNFLSKDGSNTFWGEPEIDSLKGRIKNVMGTILGKKGVSGEGSLAIITFETLNDGISPLNLENVLLTDVKSESLLALVKSGTIKVENLTPWDVDFSGAVDIIDIAIIGKSIGENVSYPRPNPLDPNPDVNRDGIVNVFDVALVGLHFGEVYMVRPRSSPRGIASEQAYISIHNRDDKTQNSYGGGSLELFVTSAEKLYGYQSEIIFDPTLIEILSAEPSGGMKHNGVYSVIPQINNQSGYVRVAATFIGEGNLPSSGSLAVIKFQRKKGSEGAFTLKNMMLIDTNFQNIPVKTLGGKIPAVVNQFYLGQNYPNPFNPETWIPYQLSQDTEVIIRIHNLKGQLTRILNLGQEEAGFYMSQQRAAYWDGCDSFGEKVASGVYFYTLQAGEFRDTRKMVIMK
ncbi:T9SS type A sorting domain-containing protein [bacterium]|nr:T9SS type A sorting domain-containing protein [bacterium]